MISFLRATASSSIFPLLPAKLMDSAQTSLRGPQTLLALAQQLRLYKPPPTLLDADDDEEAAGKVLSQLGFAESAAPITRDPQRFRPKRAAVLICLFESDAGDLRVILTKRSSSLSTHSGEIALPGGKAEEGDKDDGDTATREAKEEINLDPSLVNVVTVLEPFLSKVRRYDSIQANSEGRKVTFTSSNMVFVRNTGEPLETSGWLWEYVSVSTRHFLRVVPVIGILTDKEAFKPAPNPAEVDAVFDAPLEMFIKDENRRAEEREWMGNKYIIHFFDYETENKKFLIWGLTAGILIRAASVVYQRQPPFLEQNPVFKVPGTVNKDTILP